MQSSPNVAWRALVIVVCLVAIPLAALFGASLPDLVHRLLELRKDFTSAWAKDSAPEAPLFEGGAHDAPWKDMPLGSASSHPEQGPGRVQATLTSPIGSAPPACRPPRQTALGAERDPGASDGPGQLNSAPESATAAIKQPDVIPASYQERLDPAGNSAPVWPGESWGRSTDGNTGAGSPNSALSPAIPGEPTRSEPRPSNLVPVAQTASGQMSRLPANDLRPSSPAREYQAATGQLPRATDPFRYMLRRLHDLGATYYLLESWGSRGEYYRFHARITAVGGSADYVRHFEATDTDALRAMAKVLKDVEAWRASR